MHEVQGSAAGSATGANKVLAPASASQAKSKKTLTSVASLLCASNLRDLPAAALQSHTQQQNSKQGVANQRVEQQGRAGAQHCSCAHSPTPSVHVPEHSTDGAFDDRKHRNVVARGADYASAARQRSAEPGQSYAAVRQRSPEPMTDADCWMAQATRHAERRHNAAQDPTASAPAPGKDASAAEHAAALRQLQHSWKLPHKAAGDAKPAPVARGAGASAAAAALYCAAAVREPQSPPGGVSIRACLDSLQNVDAGADEQAAHNASDGGELDSLLRAGAQQTHMQSTSTEAPMGKPGHERQPVQWHGLRKQSAADACVLPDSRKADAAVSEDNIANPSAWLEFQEEDPLPAPGISGQHSVAAVHASPGTAGAAPEADFDMDSVAAAEQRHILHLIQMQGRGKAPSHGVHRGVDGGGGKRSLGKAGAAGRSSGDKKQKSIASLFR